MKNQTKLIGIGAIFMVLLSSVIVLAIFDDVDGPLIYELHVLPVDPVDGDIIRVIAYALDTSGVSNVQLSYTVDGTTWEVQDMSFYTCLCLAGGRWVGTFGPINGENVTEFYITAYDNSPTFNPSDTQVFSIEITTQIGELNETRSNSIHCAINTWKRCCTCAMDHCSCVHDGNALLGYTNS